MDSHALRVLEYRELLSHLARSAQSAPGRTLAEAQEPWTVPSEVRAELGLTAEAMLVLAEGGVDLGGVRDTSQALGRLRAEGAVLEPEQVLALLSNQKAVRTVRAALKGSADRCPALAALADGLTPLHPWEERVERSLSENGEVLDSASSELARARREMRSARDTAIKKLEAFSGREGVSKVLQEGYITLRNGRFVLPARPEYHRSFEGVVQDSSSSGQTLFVEPLFAVELNNRLIQAAAREQEEVRRVLASLSEEARSHRAVLMANLEILGRLDLVFARARLGRRLDAAIPSLDGEVTDLRNARHPLLELREQGGCVPIDIGVGGDARVLVITGPNTGGKTVALKTLGLLTLMAQTGMPVPADGSGRLRLFSQIFADIGDEQSLVQNLSTFSSHMTIISSILARADADTLVLLDELGAGTDPQEGSALAVALLEELSERGACTVVTTHHNLLKEFAYRAPFARNASTVFDAATLKPTYRLRTGSPGRSHALEIAGRLGIGADIVNRAQEIMGTGAVRVDELLGRLSDELERESAARTRAEELRGRLEAELTQLQERREAAREEIRRSREEARLEAKALLRDLSRRGKSLLKELRDGAGKTGGGQATLQRRVADLEREISDRLPQPPVRKPRGGPVEVGQEVEVVSLGVAGRVETLSGDGREAEILAGGVRLRVPTGQLEPVETTSGKDAKKPSGVSPFAYSGQDAAPAEINLLGCTVQDALESVDRLLDRSLLGPARRLRIVHGKGTGALRKAIAIALANDPRVAAFAPASLEEGGAGVTVVELKE